MEKEKRELEELEKIENQSKKEDNQKLPKKEVVKETEEYSEELKDSSVPLGYHKLPTNLLPSKGRFYPDDLVIFIRAAQAKEIRHWSTIDDEDPVDIVNHLNEIIKSCTRFKTQESLSFTYKDIVEVDRLYLILSIRDLSMKQKQNKIVLPIENPRTGESVQVELTNNNLDTTDLSEKYLNFYDEEKRAFHITINSNQQEFTIKPPTIGVSEKVTQFIRESQRENKFIDRTFIKVFPFLNPTWRTLTVDKIRTQQKESISWEPITVSVLINFIEGIEIGQKPYLKHVFEDGEEVTTPISFPGGIKSLFLVQDIFGEIS